ncbi:MAG TPA: PDZ domain-containing protein [Gaiellaceae bacterium]|nr:PDZ domain-containing protein [Gaiellaceae bacterium]
MRRLFTPGKVLLALAAVLVAAAVLFLVLPDKDVYIFLPDEPHAVEPLITVQNGENPDNRGGIYFVDVIVKQPSFAERFFPGVFHNGASVVPANAVNPTGLSERERRRASLQMMSRSQRLAAAVALRAAGYPVRVTEQGAFVVQVLPGTPAARALQPSDVIVEIDGVRVGTLAKLRALLATKKPGDRVSVTVRRGGKPLEFDLTLAADPSDPKRAVMGVLVEQAANIRLPLKVQIDTGNVGGPSAGLAMALGLLEKLGRDVDHGRRVAATGEIELDGSVGPVGGIKQKTIGAREAGIQVFLVPAGDNAREASRYADGMRVVPVRSFQQALQALATTG